MCSADGRYAMVFNGEIYNYLELREELRDLGHEFTTASDSEVLLAAFAQWGVDGLCRLVGMFAFAVLDTYERQLTLVRDFFGIKPLYVATWPGGLAFASEIKALLTLPSVSTRPSPRAVLDYLDHGAVDHGEQTMFADVRRVLPAHALTVSLDRPDVVSQQRYWSLPAQQTHDLSFAEATDRVREAFLESLTLHLRSDVPIGTALSGGIDSSAIVAGLRHIGGPTLDIRAFSYVADDPTISEESWVDMAGSAAGARIAKVSPPAEDLVTDLDRLIRSQDEPFGSTSIYAQHRVFQLAAEHDIKVMLDGQGADEMLAGYRPYTPVRIASMLRSGDVLGARRLAVEASRLPGSHSAPRLSAVAAASLLPAGAVTRLRRRTGGARANSRWIDHSWFASHGVESRHPFERSVTLREALRRDVETSSLPGLLRYEDRNSMAFSIESRVPFLTPSMAELVLGLPEEHLLARDGTTKSVFRAAMRGIVPDPILDRRDKIGFATPEQKWLGALHGWVDTTLRDADPTLLPGLRLDSVRAEWQDVLAGRSAFGWHVWRWLNLIRWTEIMGVETAS